MRYSARHEPILLVRVFGPTSQRDFLLNMGIEARLAGLMRATAKGVVGEETINRLKNGGLKLVDSGPDGMGITFQVLSLSNGPDDVYPWV
jgi:SAM-dependent MidA family methyltransferase